MRRVAWILLLLFAFAIPWEYSLDLGPPLGNVARILGILLLLAAVPAVLQAGRLRTPGAMQWLVLAFYVWLCCTYFWTVDPDATLIKFRAYFQEMMIVWLVWEFAESPADLRDLLRAYVAGSWVLAALTVANFGSPEAIAEGQMRFAAYGQDPNDVARFLDLGFPLAALLLTGERRWPARLLALGYLPLGLFAVLLTASRGGFLAALVALAGCAVLLVRGRGKAAAAAVFALPAAAAALWFTIPYEVFERLATIPAQLEGGDLNQRLNIWSAGWHAFVQAPFFGTGAGTFVAAAGLAPIDTAHNTALSIVVGGGLCALFLAAGIVALAARTVLRMRGALRIAMAAALLVWIVTSLVATVEESRTTWLLLALIALAGRFAEDDPEQLYACFSAPSFVDSAAETYGPAAQASGYGLCRYRWCGFCFCAVGRRFKRRGQQCEISDGANHVLPRPAQYLLRFDDLCPTVCRERWLVCCALIREFGLRPILAVVPDNQDPALQLAPPDAGFWELMRAMERDGATVALHGYRHLCTSRGPSLLPLHRESEFAGVRAETQRKWIHEGLSILRGHGLKPKMWVAPRHGFDGNTLTALLAEGIEVLSDGFARTPFLRGGLTWVPQQLWAPVHKTQGLWTISVHPNTATDAQIAQLRAFQRDHGGQFTSVERVLAAWRPAELTLPERAGAEWRLLRIRLSHFRKQMSGRSRRRNGP